jgi:hypothetical protein
MLKLNFEHTCTCIIIAVTQVAKLMKYTKTHVYNPPKKHFRVGRSGHK